ncbi:hypothetical protein HOB65_05170 [archaeon]|mgnify:FL=1|nr:hypothetical protein [archaeon]
MGEWINFLLIDRTKVDKGFILASSEIRDDISYNLNNGQLVGSLFDPPELEERQDYHKSVKIFFIDGKLYFDDYGCIEDEYIAYSGFNRAYKNLEVVAANWDFRFNLKI